MLVRPGVSLYRIAPTLIRLPSQAVKVLTVNGRAPELQVERVQRKFAEVCVLNLGDRGEGGMGLGCKRAAAGAVSGLHTLLTPPHLHPPQMYLSLDALVRSSGGMSASEAAGEARATVEGLANPGSYGAIHAAKRASRGSSFPPTYKANKRWGGERAEYGPGKCFFGHLRIFTYLAALICLRSNLLPASSLTAGVPCYYPHSLFSLSGLCFYSASPAHPASPYPRCPAGPYPPRWTS